MLRYKLTEIISGYAHGRSGRTPEEAARSGQLCRGEFEATGCVERLNEFEATDMEPQEILHLQEPPIMCFECVYQGRPSHISCAYICENDKPRAAVASSVQTTIVHMQGEKRVRSHES